VLGSAVSAAGILQCDKGRVSSKTLMICASMLFAVLLRKTTGSFRAAILTAVSARLDFGNIIPANHEVHQA
jgi:hypothetical protein